MKYILLILILSSTAASAQKHEILEPLIIPDTLKATQYLTEISILTDKPGSYGIAFSKARLTLTQSKRTKGVSFSVDKNTGSCTLLAQGLNTSVTYSPAKRGQTGSVQKFNWKYNWQKNQPYKFLVTALADSASHSSFYTGYVFLPESKQWKLLGSFKYADSAKYLKNPVIVTAYDKAPVPVSNDIDIREAWIQRTNSSWKNLLPEKANTPPLFSVTNHIDSSAQAIIDRKLILDSAKDVRASNDVFYSMIKEGSGELVKLTDTVKVYYKGWLLKDGTIFDQTKDNPATFPLARLIKGWQLGLVNCRVGGKIKMIIPSGLAYSTRSRSKDIPPNNVLVFEVEVLEAKPRASF